MSNELTPGLWDWDVCCDKCGEYGDKEDFHIYPEIFEIDGKKYQNHLCPNCKYIFKEEVKSNS